MKNPIWPWLLLSLIGLGQIFLLFPQLIGCHLGPTGALKDSDLFLKANEYIVKNQFVKAEKLLRQVSPNSVLAPKALWRLAQLKLYSQKDISAGHFLLKEIIVKFPKSEASIKARETFLGMWEVEPEFFTKASLAYMELINENPNDLKVPHWLLKSAQINLKENDFVSATKKLDRIIADYPFWENIEQAYDERANLYLITGETEKSVKIFELLLARNPKTSSSDKIKFNIAKCYEELEEYQKAANIYQKLINNSQYAEKVQKRLNFLELRLKGKNRDISKTDYGYRPER